MPLRIIEEDSGKRKKIIEVLTQNGLIATEKTMRVGDWDPDDVVIEVIAGKQTTDADVGIVVATKLHSFA